MSGNVEIATALAVKAESLIAQLGFADGKILFVSDEKIWKNCRRFFDENFIKKIDKILLLKNPHADEKNLKKIAAATKKCDLLIGLGSGTINDLCKFTSAQKKIPYVIFASAASMNGYASKNASITISGHKKTLPATLPLVIFCDLGILQSAPLALTKAGIGDSLCFYSCWFDWYLSHKICGTEFDQKPFLLLAKKMNFFTKNFQNFSLRDDAFLKLLIEILLLSGRGMTIAGGSYPASQSEHLIAHTIGMKYPKIVREILHGAQIAVTTLTSARLQKNLLENCALPLVKKCEFSLKKLEKFFGKKIALQCGKEFEMKAEISAPSEVDWKKIQKDLQKIYFDESRLKAIFSHFKIKTSPRSLGLSNAEYAACVTNAKFIRNRFTCLDF